MSKFIYLFSFIFLFSFCSHAKFGGTLGFYANMSGTLDFVELEKKAIDDTTIKGTGFGLEVSPGLRAGSFFSIGPFAMFSSISNSDDEDITYFLSGYGGEAKIRIAPINFKGGYGFYALKETVDTVKTDYDKASGWHAAVGFEALLGPGLTISLDAKYRFINFSKHGAELKSTSAVLGVTSYF